MENKERISEAEKIANTIFYSPATNGQAEASIANGVKLIEYYGLINAQIKQSKVVEVIEAEIAELALRSRNKSFIEIIEIEENIETLQRVLTKLKQ